MRPGLIEVLVQLRVVDVVEVHRVRSALAIGLRRAVEPHVHAVADQTGVVAPAERVDLSPDGLADDRRLIDGSGDADTVAD